MIRIGSSSKSDSIGPLHELSAFTLLPVGGDVLPGTTAIHPKQALPPAWYKAPQYESQKRIFATAMNGEPLSISPKDSLEHTFVLGATGVGKSTLLQRLILSDIYAGRGVLVCDPKTDLCTDICERIPKSRHKDVVLIDPVSPNPVGFNPLAAAKYADKELVADTILSVLKEIFASSWGVRTQDLLNGCLQTLVHVEGTSLMWLPELLTNARFRANIIKNVNDEIALKPFWERFEAMTDYERRQQIEPVLNKLRNFLLRPRLRDVLGQENPKFDLNDLFTKNKLVLISLNKGILGQEASKLLGSLIIGMTWALALGRAKLPQEKRKMVSLYVDELHEYLSLPTDLSSALAMSRSMGLAMHLATQYRAQIPPELRAGVDVNCRNKIMFNLNGSDARDVAALEGGLDPLDFSSLMRYHVYANFQSGGRSTGWVQGVTFPKTEPLQGAAELRAVSMKAYGIPAEEVEAQLASRFRDIGPDPAEEAKTFKSANINRKTAKKSAKDDPIKDAAVGHKRKKSDGGPSGKGA